jgi:hypothetical protein
MESETTGAVQEPEVSVPAAESVSTSDESYTGDQVRWFAEVEAKKVQSTKDREIADRDKLIRLGSITVQKNQELEDKIRELQEAEEARLDKAAGEDRELFDAVQLRKKTLAQQAELAKRQQELDWEALELHDLRETKAKLERLSQVEQIGKEYALAPEQVADLAENGGSLEQIRFYASRFAALNTEAKPQVEPAHGVPSGGSMNWEAIKAGYAKGEVSHETYTKAREEHFKK